MQGKFIKYVVLFFVPVILGYAIIEYMTLNLPMNYLSTSQYLEEEKDSIEVILLGSSQMNDGIDPALLDKPSLNLASGDQHHDTDFKILKGLIDRLPNLNTVVLEVSYSHFELPHNGKDFWKNSVYLKYYEVNNFERVTYFKDRLIFLSHPPFFSKKLDEHYLKRENTSTFNRYGFDTENYSGRFKSLNYDEEKISVSRFKINTKPDPEIFRTNTSLFFEMIQYLEERDLNIILCHTPVYKTYLPKRDRGILRRRDSIVELTRRMNPDIILLNKEKDTISYNVYDFTNQSHLNSHGAKLFTATLNEILNSLPD
jgi:hypothetical protein